MGLISDVIKKISKKIFFPPILIEYKFVSKYFVKKNNFMAKNPCFPGNHLNGIDFKVFQHKKAFFRLCQLPKSEMH